MTPAKFNKFCEIALFYQISNFFTCDLFYHFPRRVQPHVTYHNINKFKPRHDGLHFADIVQRIFKWRSYYSDSNFTDICVIDMPALVQMMAGAEQATNDNLHKWCPCLLTPYTPLSLTELTHWGRNAKATILLMAFYIPFLYGSRISYENALKVSAGGQLTIIQHWFI